MSNPNAQDIKQGSTLTETVSYALSTSEQRKLIEEYLLDEGLPITGLAFDFVWKTPGSRFGYLIFGVNSIRRVKL